MNSIFAISVFGYSLATKDFLFYRLNASFHTSVKTLQPGSDLPVSEFGYRYTMYRSDDGKDVVISDRSSFILQSSDHFLFPTFLLYIDNQFYKFDAVINRFIPVSSHLIDFQEHLLLAQTNEIANSHSIKSTKFLEIQNKGLPFKYQVYQYLPYYLLENKGVIAQNYIMLRESTAEIGLHPLCLVSMLIPANYLISKQIARSCKTVMRKCRGKKVMRSITLLSVNVALFVSLKRYL